MKSERFSYCLSLLAVALCIAITTAESTSSSTIALNEVASTASPTPTSPSTTTPTEVPSTTSPTPTSTSTTTPTEVPSTTSPTPTSTSTTTPTEVPSTTSPTSTPTSTSTTAQTEVTPPASPMPISQSTTAQAGETSTATPTSPSTTTPTEVPSTTSPTPTSTSTTTPTEVPSTTSPTPTSPSTTAQTGETLTATPTLPSTTAQTGETLTATPTSPSTTAQTGETLTATPTSPSTTAQTGETLTATPTTTSPSTSAPTDKPDVKDILTQTQEVLSDIEETLNTFLNAWDQTTPAPASPSRIGRAVVLNEEDSNFDDICKSEGEIDWCLELQESLKGVESKVNEIKSKGNDWNESDLDDLKAAENELNAKVTEGLDEGLIVAQVNEGNAKSSVDVLIKEVKEANDDIQNTLDGLNNSDDNGVVFVAVFGTIGGLIVVALIVTISVAAIKGKKAKKGKKGKQYKQVSEQTVPVAGFLNDHDNMAFQPDEPRHDSHALKEYNPAAPRSRDPYARQPETRVEDLYAKPNKPKKPEATRAKDDYYYSNPAASNSSDYYSSPTHRTDDYYSRQPSTKTNDYYRGSPNGGPSRGIDYHDKNESRKPSDPYSVPQSKSTSPPAGLRRYN